MSNAMVFLVYTPRADSAGRGYEDFLRGVDNPFFNAQPGIQHYSNWKLLEGAARNPGFSHFDFMLLDERAAPQAVFGSQVVQKFTAEWTAQWGRAPNGPRSENCHSYLAALISKRDLNWTNYLTLAFDDESAPGETWRVTGQLLGQAPFKTYTRKFVTTPGESESAFRAELIAAP